MFYKLLARLLAYPDEALLAALPQLHGVLNQGLEAAEYLVLERFLRHLASMPLTESQADYVQTFDLTPEHALHLTHHLFGDDKNRGPALIDLSEYYKQYGLEIAVHDGGFGELPDFLPLMLEFCAQLAEDEARMFLSKWTKVLNQLASNLEEAASPYAPLVRLLEQRSRLGQTLTVATA
ncbi:MAG TPA: nitrate reductase molybdenum cofactor assembly chaperone [Thiobacillaceae bacterium]|nr:nitrate reductase molybdenum cofactor assembly chaperone [Thiobacillaceae bacterium]HNU63457.1 nitrate reductase molybdenum cofactor assembly chaperone [Thiobacillaceae bacterium]